MRYLGELPRRFLHFSDHPEQVKQTLLPKAERNLNGSKAAVIYREGVFVREIEECSYPSLHDYNLRAAQLPIDESRNSSEYVARVAVARTLRTAQSDELIPVLRSLVERESTFESEIDPDYICPSWQTPAEEEKNNWQTAWKAVAADAVLCGPSPIIAEFVERKGRTAKCISSPSMVQASAGSVSQPRQKSSASRSSWAGKGWRPRPLQSRRSIPSGAGWRATA